MRPLITLLLLTFTCFYSASSRVISQTLFAAFFTNETAQTVGRFTTAPGKGEYTLKIRSTPIKAANDTTGTIAMEFLVLRQDDWLQYTKKVCDNQTTTFHTHQVQVPLDSTEVLVRSQDLGNEHSSETFYFVLRDCFGDYKTKFLQGNRLSYDLIIKNTDGSHLSEEENGVNTVLLLALVPLAAFLIHQSTKIIDFYYHQKAIDFPVLMLTLGLLLEFCAVLFELLHLWAYSSRGKGYVALDWMNTAFAYLSRFIISLLLILMATGWTFKPLNQEKKETFIVTGVIFGAMIIAMALSGKGNDLKNFHDYQNIPGKIFLVINVILFAFFAYELRKNYNESDDVIVKGHYKRLGIFGTIYLMSLPIIVVFADLFVSLHARHKMITYGAIVVQSLTLVGYAITLAAVSKNNEFYPVHYKNRTIISAGKLI